MQEEKKKKGIWNKLKNVLFVDDDDDDEKEEGLPDYNKVEESVKKEEKPTEKEESIVNTSKDFTYEVKEDKTEEIEKDKETEAPKEFELNEEKASPFLSFDELEFERLTSRVTRNESRVKEEPIVEDEKKPVYNLPPTNKEPIFSRSTMSSVNNTNISGKKPFSPSPVISPVYGILDKNYRKDDIVDKRTDRRAELDELDRVRKKAYGSRSEKKKEEIVVEEVKDIEKNKLDELNFDEIKVRKPSILEEDSKNIGEDITYKNAKKFNEEKEEKKKPSLLETELNTMLDNDVEEDYVEEEKSKKSGKMDDLEKTSTLRILDDIEKELNSIKPVGEEDNEETSDNGKKSQIDEKDIFNMISSMYVGGDDEDDSD